MKDHALEVLEFERVLDRVAHRASSEVGRSRIRALRPGSDPSEMSRELHRVAATMRFVEAAPSWGPGPLPDVRGELTTLDVQGALLDPHGLHRVGVVLTSSRLLAGEFGSREERYPELEALSARLVDLRSLEGAIQRCVDEEGHVLSSASPELKRIRDRLRGAHAKIVKLLERYLGTLPDRFVVSDASVTVRDGRYVIPVRREGKGEVGGIVHDESQTGATLFVEPPVAIEATNRLRDLEREEAREVRRVLGEMTERLAAERAMIEGAFYALVDFDTLHARARTALAWQATPPVVLSGRREGLELRDARHPLLMEADATTVVPFDLVLDPDQRCLVVSGPNTGGKSVFLKATGLIVALAQSGCVPPVGPGTRLPVFTSLYADIGDEQSIAQSLSTFSAHLANLSDLVSQADEGSLVLIDEMGTGTDPAEGAALSRAILEELVSRGATTLVSSHLGELKQLDTPGSGIVNASMQFDGDRMQPTYRLVMGRPGRSYGLAIARRLGFPGDVLDRAQSHLDDGTERMEELLERLEHAEREAASLVEELDRERERTEELGAELARRASELREAERTAEERARTDARRLLLEARTEVEDAIRDLRASVDLGASLDAAARSARRTVERAAHRHREAVQAGAPSRGAARPTTLTEGDAVRIRSTGAIGRIAELRDGRGVIEVGAFRFEVRLEELEAVEGPAPEARDRGGWTGPEKGEVRTEVDLRGLRVDEMAHELERVLDHAVLEDLPELRIIHGKGTGALRTRVSEILSSDSRVRSFRMGGPGEGGAGVTVVDLGVGS